MKIRYFITYRFVIITHFWCLISSAWSSGAVFMDSSPRFYPRMLHVAASSRHRDERSVVVFRSGRWWLLLWNGGLSPIIWAFCRRFVVVRRPSPSNVGHDIRQLSHGSNRSWHAPCVNVDVSALRPSTWARIIINYGDRLQRLTLMAFGLRLHIKNINLEYLEEQVAGFLAGTPLSS